MRLREKLDQDLNLFLLRQLFYVRTIRFAGNICTQDKSETTYSWLTNLRVAVVKENMSHKILLTHALGMIYHARMYGNLAKSALCVVLVLALLSNVDAEVKKNKAVNVVLKSHWPSYPLYMEMRCVLGKSNNSTRKTRFF